MKNVQNISSECPGIANLNSSSAIKFQLKTFICSYFVNRPVNMTVPTGVQEV